VRWPEEDHDLVNRAYVYFVAGKRLPIEGGTMQGQIDINQHSIRNINPNPQNEDGLVPKWWIEENFLNRYSPVSTMAIDLNMDAHHVSYLRAPEEIHHAATKGYADTKLLLLGGDMQGEIGMARNRVTGMANPQADQDAVSKKTLDDMIQAQQLYFEEHFVSADAVSQLRGPVSFNG